MGEAYEQEKQSYTPWLDRNCWVPIAATLLLFPAPMYRYWLRVDH